MSNEGRDQQAWIEDVKHRYGIRAIGDEETATLPPYWPDLPEGAKPGDYQVVKLSPMMASPDGRHWYEKPDGMTTVEFLTALPPPAALAFDPCRVYWGSHGCDLERGHVEREGTPHDCGCCDCGEHHPYPEWPETWAKCVAKEPYYGPETNFYGEDANPESVGRWGRVIN